ncbi:hypothetical protein COCON_G00134060 [Conger conger]|uniref:Uncharacterized protein n=1 Tax=Conger conger TaxID=82655 RepID=A0A9Q1DEH0_CONCO|nr:hypothetical protein COCON_G00134060 [Conger conger]
MSGKNSVGDLVPRDITEVLARESKTNKSKRKQGASFSRAFSWLKGTKRKSTSNGQSRGARAGAGESRVGKPTQLDPNSAKALGKEGEAQWRSLQHFAGDGKEAAHVFERTGVGGVSSPQLVQSGSCLRLLEFLAVSAALCHGCPCDRLSQNSGRSPTSPVSRRDNRTTLNHNRNSKPPVAMAVQPQTRSSEGMSTVFTS